VLEVLDVGGERWSVKSETERRKGSESSWRQINAAPILHQGEKKEWLVVTDTLPVLSASISDTEDSTVPRGN